jgi:hypothetical protein
VKPKPKFKVGQVVQNRYYARDYGKLQGRKFGAAQNDNEEWAYTFYKQGMGTVWFEESMLRALYEEGARPMTDPASQTQADPLIEERVRAGVEAALNEIHEGAVTAFDDEFIRDLHAYTEQKLAGGALDRTLRAAVYAERERCAKVLCPYCQRGNPVVEYNDVVTANGSPFWHLESGVYCICGAAAIRKGEASE